MTYNLEFKSSALKEWKKLEPALRQRFKKKLAERLEHPRVEASQLHGLPDCYKIKLRTAGYRLVYQVIEDRLVVQVIAVGPRDHDRVYDTARQRL
jgi:mRNA interferase RelE/StbE